MAAATVANDSFPVEGLLPRQATRADAFTRRFPNYDGRNVRVAVLDTGVDPAAIGLNGPNKMVDIIDCTGAGDIKLKEVSGTAKDDAIEIISQFTGRTLLASPSWPNPTGVWRVGTKRAYDLWPTELVKRRTADRRRAFEVSHSHLVDAAAAELAAFEKEGSNDIQKKTELTARVQGLKDLLASWDDPGPILEAIVFHDGTHWRAAVGGAEGEASDPTNGEPEAYRANVVDIRNSPTLTNFATERQWATFGQMDLLTYSVNILDEGKLLSLVTLSGTHGTHVAGIIGAQHEDTATNGVAPGVEIVSLKIGDARLGSMEQGQALLRAAQALVDTKCDVANMSYGEDGAFGVEDKGAFASALHKLVRDHGICFVSSAGNNGPALTTVGQPGGTTSGVLSVGAYVNAGAMQRAEYALVEQGVKSSVTTWSSRGPTADGAAGVSIYAPGAAITSICRYALQSTQLMNGTSMSSPNAAGCVALLISAMKAEGIPVTPQRVFSAIQTTGADVNDPLGVRFIDVEKAWEHIQAYRDVSYADATFDVAVTPAGKPLGGSALRGVYLRSAEQSKRVNQFNVTVAPRYRHTETERAFELEIRTSLCGTAPWIQVPEFLVIGGNGRTFEIRVDPRDLPPGLHHGQVLAYDTARPGVPVFAVPVNVVIPVVPDAPTHRLSTVRLQGGAIERQFIHVPAGATWANVRIRTERHEITGTSARLWLHMVQLEPHHRLSKVEHSFIAAANQGEPIEKRINVCGGLTMEVCIAQFWASRAAFDVEIELEFHGVTVAPVAGGRDELTIIGGEGLARIEAVSALRVEELRPALSFHSRRSFVRPSSGKITPQLLPRDRQLSGRQLSELVLEYPLSFKSATKATLLLPISGNLYDSAITLLTQLVDRNNRIVAFGDVYAKQLDLKKGEYTLRAQILHESPAVLERLRTMTLTVNSALSKPQDVQLDIFNDHVDLVQNKQAKFSGIKLLPGERTVLCFDTNLTGDKLPSDAQPGDVILGSFGFAPKGQAHVRYIVPPAPSKDDKSPSDSPKLAALLAGLVPQVPAEERSDFLARIAEQHPNSLEILVARLQATKTVASDLDEALAAAQAIDDAVDEKDVLLFAGAKKLPDAEQTDETRRHAKEMGARKSALELALARQAYIYLEKGDQEKFDAVIARGRALLPDVGTDSDVQRLFSRLVARWHFDHGRPGQALANIRKFIAELGAGTKETLSELSAAHELEREIYSRLGWDLWQGYATRWSWLNSPKEVELF
ncbi:tripeptidyl-peptidase II [Malassezia cuniculi]|uniref:tripeptidyl-peptidase II n=1 Tax=Malassezia cuniculi TaxID=948313 RepID=A0AAF0JCV7_9BASI|nr:tripeptidyl-peptidase II [Malassezia cuniculi]